MSHFQLDIQSHFFIWRSKPPSFLSLGIQSCILNFRHSEPPSFFSFGIQSHHRVFSLMFKVIIITSQLDFRVTVLVLAFRAIIGHQFDVHSRILNFDVQSHHHFSAQRSESHFQYQRSEPMLVFPFGVQSRSPPSFGIQSHLSSFGVQSHYPFPAWLSEPPCLFVYDVQSRLSQHDIPSYQFSRACRAFVSD